MQEDVEELKNAYNKAAWNDMVSEKARIQLNEYIDAYNRAIEELSSVISAVSEMCQELDSYENVIEWKEVYDYEILSRVWERVER